MKLLCIGDLHITLSALEFIDRILTPYLKDLIACERIDTVVFLGDILDYDKGKVSVLEMDCAVQLFAAVSAVARTFVLVGNHDYIDPHQFLTDKHWMNALKGKENLYIVDHVMRAGRALFCPYVPPGRFMEALESVDLWRDAALICAHQGFNGARWRAGICVGGDDWAPELPPVISGHIHTYQKMDNGVWYTGSMEEGQQNTLLVAEIDKDRPAQIRPLKMGRLTTMKIAGTVEEILSSSNALRALDITIKDTAENIARFKETLEFKELDARNVVRLVPHTIPFLELYRRNVLDLGDAFAYCAAEKILLGTEQDEAQHLFIKLV